jgi:hypothetical protein
MVDKTLTVSGMGPMGYPIPVLISDITDQAVTEAALAPTGTTATAAELNKLHGVTAGTTAASLALVVDANKQLDALNVTTLGLGSGRTALTATGTELNTLHSVTAGTTAASKALVVDANKQLDALNVTALGLGSGRTALTATGAELNTLHSVTPGTTAASSALVVDSNKQLDALNVTTLGVGAARLAMSGSVRAAQHTVTSGEASAHTMAITSGATSIVAQFVQILRSGAAVTGDAAISVSGGTITVADGASTYAVTAGDVVNWLAVGA